MCESWERIFITDTGNKWDTTGLSLGPILSVIVINDLPDIVESTCQLFADDAKIFRSVKTIDGSRILQDDIKKLVAWSKRWQLPFNVDKCKSLHTGRTKRRPIYEMEGQQLGQLEGQKDLGVIVDDAIKFHKQTAAAVKKANTILGLVRKSFAVLDNNTVPALYKSLIRPHLEYGNVIWGPFFKEDITAVEKVQRRATKVVPELKDHPYETKLHALKLPSLLHRRRRGDMIYTYTIITDKMNIHKEDFSNVTSQNARSSIQHF